MEDRKPHQVVVVGGGVAGLAVSFELLSRSGEVPGGLELLCLEASGRPGGNIRTEEMEGFITEWGPNGFLDNVPATLDLVRRLGLEGRLFPADEAAARRFIFRRGRLRKLPGGPLSFLGSDVLSWPGKLRVLWEPFGPGPAGKEDESIFDFAARRIGREAARVLVGAMVTGIYGGDAKQLSLRACFPKMWRMEAECGSLTRAMLKRRREARAGGGRAGGPAGPGGRLTSFQGGLQELVDALARALGPALRLESRVTGITKLDGGTYRVDVAGEESREASAVVLSIPSWHASKVLAPLDSEISGILGEIPPAPLAVVHLGFDDSQVGGRPNGFGYLVPRGEGVRILGTLWSSSIFPGRAPRGQVLLTTMVGGAHDPGAVNLDDGDLLELVEHDLRKTMGIGAPPLFSRIFRHPRGIPQYTIGHPARLEAMEERLKAHPGLLVSGNSYRGISVNSCVEEAPRIAGEVLGWIKNRVK